MPIRAEIGGGAGEGLVRGFEGSAPRRRRCGERRGLLCCHARSTKLLLPYTWQIERERGWLHRTPDVLRGVVSAPGLPGLPPWLAADLSVTLLLRRLALLPAAGMLQSLSLLAAVRGRNELLVASAGGAGISLDQ